MALAVLELSPTARVVSASRVLEALHWRAVADGAALRQEAEVALQRACELARERAADEVRARADALERRLHRQVLLKTMSLQLEHERALRDLRERFVQTLLSALQAMLTPLPPEFFARAHASATALLGTASEAVLHVSAADEQAARAGLARAGSPEAVRVEVDPDVEPGQCWLDTRFGRVQAGLHTQLEALNEALQTWWSAP
jgi:flagellar biosynthesis/type III secretory pathway protein FliH